MQALGRKMQDSSSKAAEYRWRYGLLVEEIAVDGLRSESYGVMVTDEATGQEAKVHHVTASALDAAALLDVLVRGKVSPVTLRDVVEDWLER